MSNREFRVIKETRGADHRYFPQYRYKRWTWIWLWSVLDGENDWQYWIGTPTWAGLEYTSFIPVMFKTQPEAEAYVELQQRQDEQQPELVA